MLNKTMAVLGVLAVVSAGSLLGEGTGKLNVNIPFEFNVGKSKLPAGQYVIEPSAASATLLLKSRDQKFRKLVITIPMETRWRGSQSQLVFNRYGSDYFLAEVWSGAQGTGSRIPTTRFERELAARVARPAEQTSIAVSAP